MTDSGRVVTAKLPDELVLQMDEVAERIDRSKSWIMRQAVAEWLAEEQRRHELTLDWDARRWARTSGLALSQIFRGASGTITVPMSRPAITRPGGRINARCAGRMAARTSGCAETRETAAST